MRLVGSIVICVLIAVGTRAWSHRRHGIHGSENENLELSRQLDFQNEIGKELLAKSRALEKSRRSLNVDEVKGNGVPFSARRLEKMLEKAILKIITGDLNPANLLLLKSLNYSLEEVLAIRARELSRRKDEDTGLEDDLRLENKIVHGTTTTSNRKDKDHKDHSSRGNSYERHETPKGQKERDQRQRGRSTPDEDFDFDAYNRQAVLDYENLASPTEARHSSSDRTTLDYEEEASVEAKEEKDSPESFHKHFDRAMEPHVVFKIRYDDSEFDSTSDERSRAFSTNRRPTARSFRHRRPTTSRHEFAVPSNTGNSFHASALITTSSFTHPPPSPPTSIPRPISSYSPLAALPLHPPLPLVPRTYDRGEIRVESLATKDSSTIEMKNFSGSGDATDENFIVPSNETEKDRRIEVGPGRVEDRAEGISSIVDSTSHRETVGTGDRKVNEYEGLEWVEDDVYRVIPSIADSLSYDTSEDNESSDYDDASSGYYPRNLTLFIDNPENDTSDYQNDVPDSVRLFMANVNSSIENTSLANLSAYQQLAIAHRREGNLTSAFDSQGQKAIEDIKSRVLALTGRFNLTSNANQVQRERLTMFSPTCQIPRNTDSETWSDPFSMNMHFLLNLTSGDHVVAAKLRIYKLPQENLTSSSAGTVEEEEEDEKKIRISIYYYTKSLKKHRSKKRLMDSVVTPLTSEGTHLALDVRQGLRFWRLSPRNQHGNGSNHGLVIQVEDQDGRPLKPALYIQEPSCQDHETDQKAYRRLPALFVRACTRYVRIVNGEAVTYVNCRH